MAEMCSESWLEIYFETWNLGVLYYFQILKFHQRDFEVKDPLKETHHAVLKPDNFF